MKSFLDKSLKNSKSPKWLKSRQLQIIIGSLLLFAVIHFLYYFTVFDFKYDYVVNDLVTEDILLEDDYYDASKTETLKEAAKYDVDETYNLDPTVYASAKAEIGEFYNRAYDTRTEYNEDELLRMRVLKYLLGTKFDLSSEELDFIASMDEFELRLSESYIYDTLKGILTEGVTGENVISTIENVPDYFKNIDQLSDEAKEIAVKIVQYNIKANKFVDDVATEALIAKKVNDVDDVILSSGYLVAKAGDVLDQRAFDIISEQGLNNLHTLEQKIPLFVMDGQILLILIMMNLVLNYHGLHIAKKMKNKEIYMNFTIVIFMFLVTFGFNTISIYLIPIATVGMLISLLSDVTTGVIYSFFLTILYGITFSLPTEIIVFTLFGSIISSILVYKVFLRSRIFLAGLSVSALNVLVILVITILTEGTLIGIVELLMYGFISGVLCSVITIGSLPIWEQTFKILTPIKLLEYANPNHPLMRKLLLEAPGTYHHSILVANLSEAAAHDIQCNSILTRVGAYYHDIGKTNKPYLFVENQYDGHNPHDQYVPRVSAKIIKNHIKNGIKLGKQYKLPKEIIAFIEQHHGTTMIKYFYHKAKEDNEIDIDKKAYTYEGPLPTSKEIAIVMLADSVEAAVRSIKNPDKQSVKDLISKIIQSKISSHQLDESELTLKEIHLITESFVSNLSGAFHERIEYPELEEAEHQLNIIK